MSAASGAARKGKGSQRDGAADRLKAEAIGLVGALGDRAMASVLGRLQDTAGRLTDYVEGGAGPGLMAAVTGGNDTGGNDKAMEDGAGDRAAKGAGPIGKLLGRGRDDGEGDDGEGKGGRSGGKGRNLKVTNIVESIDVGAPLRLTYDLWTQFADFPSFMKKVENVEQAEDEKLNWKAQVFWSHRTWEATILEQSPDDKIIWRSKGAKGYVDGAVTFHELAPNLTRILLVLEYHPQGFFEHTGNIWRAQGRRVRLEFKHFRRHLMTEVLLHPDDIQGWRGVIRDGEVVEEDEAPPDQDAQDQDAQDQDEEYPDQEGEYAEADEEADDQYDGDEADETSDEEAAPEDSADGAARERPGRSGRAPARRRQPAARPRQASRGGRGEERQQRAPSRAGARAGRAGGEDQ